MGNKLEEVKRCDLNVNMDFDDLLESVGDFGHYQIILLLLLCLPAGIPVAFYSLNLVFIQATPEHFCNVKELDHLNLSFSERRNLSIPMETRNGQHKYSQCTQFVPYSINHTSLDSSNPIYFDYNHTEKCNSWHYDKAFYDHTIVTDWDLVCDRDWWPPFVFAVFNLGTVIGNILFGYSQDRLGRKPSFFICLSIQLVSGVVASFSVNVYMLSVFRLLVGLTIPAILNAPLVLVIELVGPSHHTLVTLLICLCYSLSITLIPLLAYLINHWLYFSLATSAPFVLFYILYWFMPESPRWLVAVNKLDEAEKVLMNIARTNKSNVTQSKLQQMLSFVSASTRDSTEQEYSGVNIAVLFRYPNLRKKTICVTLLWLSNLMVYIGLSYTIPVLSGDPYINFVLAGVAELPAYPILYVLLDRWGRRWLITISMVIAGIACISTAFIPPDLMHVQLILALVGKVCISTSFVINYIYTAEIYPTVVRGLGLGFSNFVACIGNIGLPFIIYLGNEWMVLPVVIMGCIAVVGGFAGSFLPETLHQHLPQTIQDGEKFGSDHAYFQWLPLRPASHSPGAVLLDNNPPNSNTDYKGNTGENSELMSIDVAETSGDIDE